MIEYIIFFFYSYLVSLYLILAIGSAIIIYGLLFADMQGFSSYESLREKDYYSDMIVAFLIAIPCGLLFPLALPCILIFTDGGKYGLKFI